MAIPHYLAMTAAEMRRASPLPDRAAWMACHFSPYSLGLTNLPQNLPKGSLLILNDRTPIHGHSPERICRELRDVMLQFECRGLLVDFQNARTEETAALTEYLAQHLQLPLGLPPDYDAEGAAVFVPPIPADRAAEEFLLPWKGREIWLETALEGQSITVTKDGASIQPNRKTVFETVHRDDFWKCHYSVEESPEKVVFHTWRTLDDLTGVLEKAEQCGAVMAVGLYQEMRNPD